MAGPGAARRPRRPARPPRLRLGGAVTAVRRFPPVPRATVPIPDTLDPRLVDALRARGIEQLYSHQASAFELVAKGDHCVVVTPTASGKTLCYNLPVLQALVQRARGARALPVPDQGARPGPARRAGAARAGAARHADVHLRRRHAAGRAARGAGAGQPRADQPRHAALGDPAAPHQVGRASSRTSATSSSTSCTPTAASSAATSPTCCGGSSASAGTTARRRSSSWPRPPSPTRASWPSGSPAQPVELIAESGAPTGEKIFVCYNPPVVNPELGIRAPYLGEAAKLATPLLRAEGADDRLRAEPARHRGPADRPSRPRWSDATGDSRTRARLPRRLPAEPPARGRAGAARGRGAGRGVDQRARARHRHRPSRRRRARRLPGHHRLAVAAGGPRRAAHRALGGGAGGHSAPLDQFIVTHPDYLFGAPPEHARINPDNPFILVNHLKCAAFELPFADGRGVRRRRTSPLPGRPRGRGGAPPGGRPLPLDVGDLPGRPHLAAHASPPTTSS